MRLLLDTHIAIWALKFPERLSAPVRALILDPENAIFVSAASVWEIAIKFALGKKSAPPFSGKDAVHSFGKAGYMLLDVTPAQAAAVGDLPHIHSDPFDRLIAAQSLIEDISLISADESFDLYGVNRLWK